MICLALVVGAGWLLPPADKPNGPAPSRMQVAAVHALEPSPAPTVQPSPAVSPQVAPPPPLVSPPTTKRSEPTAPEHLYVSGKRVPLRETPAAGSPILDRLGSGQAVAMLERRGDWVRVRHDLTQREGWMQAKRLRDQPSVNAEAAEPKPKPASVGPVLATAAIAKLLIAASLASYPSSCPCPYNTDRGGRSCGRRSAYTRPGGYAPLCYAKDITPEMVAAYRASH